MSSNAEMEESAKKASQQPIRTNPEGATFVDEAEKKSIFANKSRITNSIFENKSSEMDLAIEEVEKDHYLYRRGSTQLHVQAYVPPDADELEGGHNEKLKSGLKLISTLLGIILFIVTFAIKMANAITSKVSETVVDQYILALYVYGTIWTSYYIVKGFLKNKDQLKFLKNNQSSNRWLKGVVVLFGMAIVIRNGLTFISYMMTDVSNCSENNIKISISVFQAAFIMVQTKYIFKYSKVYIRNCSRGSRTGLMLIIAINLSTWILAVIDETLHALHTEESHHGESTDDSHFYSSNIQPFASEEKGNSSEIDECTCDNNFCVVAEVAETFLFPFLIEFSLVASCLLYITWENVGKIPPACEKVIKPSYKFFGHYLGGSLGSVILFFTIIFLILLGTSTSSIPKEDKDYFTENYQLLLYDCFLTATETLMFIATAVGFYLFHRVQRPLEKAPLLDQVLLVICVLGPLLYNVFSMIAVITGMDNRIGVWIFTLFNPLIDIIQCIFQLVFILYGLRREPVTSSQSREFDAQLKERINQHRKYASQEKENESVQDKNDEGFDNKTLLRSRRNSVTSAIFRLGNSNTVGEPSSLDPGTNNVQFNLNVGNETSLHVDAPEIVVSPTDDEEKGYSETDLQDFTSLSTETPIDKNHSVIKIVSEVHVARPDRLRRFIRDVLMFLLLSNACLWLFMSLSGTAFTVYKYETNFYGESAWTTIAMVCRPLMIFYRMHSAGCLFEMWSYA